MYDFLRGMGFPLFCRTERSENALAFFVKAACGFRLRQTER
jgi:hypothetical protein